MAGMATALAIDPQLPRAWRTDAGQSPVLRAVPWKNKVLASVGYMAMVKYQLRRLSQGRPSQPKVAPALALLQQQWETQRRNRQYRRWVHVQPIAA